MGRSLSIRRIALDTNVVLDLAKGEEFAHEVREALQAQSILTGCPPTVLQEIMFLGNSAPDPETRRIACLALSQFRDWQIHPWQMIPVGNGITERFHRHLVSRGLLPDEEENDAFIIAETALMEIEYLISSDHHMLDIPEDALRSAMDEMDLNPVTICQPRRMAGRLRGRQS